MKNRLQNILYGRKTLYLVLAIVMVSVFTLSIAYAAMSAVLEIHGNSEVVASSWNIHLENVKVKSGSVSANAPQISGTSSVGFDIELNMPGEFYEFTVDVVNDGSIAAMIDSVVKTPELTSEQAKYIKYEITYENGESISTKQTLKKGTSTPIKVRVEYRKDLVAGDLPSTATELSLKLTLVYVQSDGTGSEIIKDGHIYAKVINGDYDTVGSEVCIDTECFYVISSDDISVTMLAKYNLHVGNEVTTIDLDTGEPTINVLVNPTGIQDEDAIGVIFDSDGNYTDFPWIGTTAFSSDSQKGTDYSGSIVEGYVNNYASYLEGLGTNLKTARLITKEELEGLGCIVSSESCSQAPSWVYSTSYWSGSAYNTSIRDLWFVDSTGYYGKYLYSGDYELGVRPVITISKDYF